MWDYVRKERKKSEKKKTRKRRGKLERKSRRKWKAIVACPKV